MGGYHAKLGFEWEKIYIIEFLLEHREKIEDIFLDKVIGNGCQREVDIICNLLDRDSNGNIVKRKKVIIEVKSGEQFQDKKNGSYDCFINLFFHWKHNKYGDKNLKYVLVVPPISKSYASQITDVKRDLEKEKLFDVLKDKKKNSKLIINKKEHKELKEFLEKCKENQFLEIIHLKITFDGLEEYERLVIRKFTENVRSQDSLKKELAYFAFYNKIKPCKGKLDLKKICQEVSDVLIEEESLISNPDSGSNENSIPLNLFPNAI